jgi:putative MATE family efflux protein
MKNLLEPSAKRRLFQMAWPLFIETALLLLIGSVDTVMVARYANDASGAVGVGNQIIALFNMLFMIISVGSGILVSQFIGAGIKDKVSTITVLSLLLNFTVGLLSALALVFFAPTFLGWLGLKGTLLSFGTTYVRIVGAGSVFQSLSMSIGAVVRAHGHTKTAMKASLTANLFNVVLNYVLIYGVPFLRIPSLGVAGAAIATLVSKAINFGLLAIVLFRSVDRGLSWKLLRPFPNDLFRKLLKIGFPSTGENLSYNASQLMITAVVTAIGVTALNTKTFFATLCGFIYAFTVAVGNATGVMVGQATGKNDPDFSDRLTRFSLFWAETITVLITLMLALAIRPAMQLFTDNPEIIGLAQQIVWIDLALEVGRAANILLGVALKSAGDVLFPVSIAVVISWTVMIPLAYGFGIFLGWGLPGVYVALAADELARGTILFSRWHSQKWRNRSFVPKT